MAKGRRSDTFRGAGIGVLLPCLIAACTTPPRRDPPLPIRLASPLPRAYTTPVVVPSVVAPTPTPLAPMPSIVAPLPTDLPQTAPPLPILPPPAPLPVMPVRWAFIRTLAGTASLVLYDPIAHVLQEPARDWLPDPVFAVAGHGLVLTGDREGAPLLYDPQSSGIDPLPEITDAAVGARADLSGSGTVIAYTATLAGRRRVQLFDRLTRTINVLGRLNTNNETDEPALDMTGRWLACVVRRPGQSDVALYDTVTGLTDPLPSVNSRAGAVRPALDVTGRYLAYITATAVPPGVRIFDRQMGGIDSLPALHGLGTAVGVRFLGDGRRLMAAFEKAGRAQTVVYDRMTGFIDALPEVNAAGADVIF